MKPSPYFADKFRYFFKRFYYKESLLRWFIKRAGDASESFEIPMKLPQRFAVLAVLPEQSDDVLSLFPLLQTLESKAPGRVTILANRRHEKLLETLRIQSEILAYSGLGCRYGEAEFQALQETIRGKNFSICLYLEPKPLFQLLYLSKSCGAAYRFGFDVEKYYPLLNLSLTRGDPKLQAECLDRLIPGVPG